MKILIDSREQRPFDFASFDVAPETAGLPCGDYSLPATEGGNMQTENERLCQARREVKLIALEAAGCLADCLSGKHAGSLYHAPDVVLAMIQGRAEKLVFMLERGGERK